MVSYGVLLAGWRFLGLTTRGRENKTLFWQGGILTQFLDFERSKNVSKNQIRVFFYTPFAR